MQPVAPPAPWPPPGDERSLLICFFDLEHWIEVRKTEDVSDKRSLRKSWTKPSGWLQDSRGFPWPDPSRSDPRRLPGAAVGDDRRRSPRMLTLDGLEIIAVLVVMGLFIKVLEQFGMFEPVGGEGNRTHGRLVALLNSGRVAV